MYPGRSDGLIYTISIVGHKPATLLTYNDETDFDTKIQVFQDSIVGKCVAGNGGDHNCSVKTRVIFNSVDTESYTITWIIYVSVSTELNVTRILTLQL